jgi:hypothetical protein
VLADTNNPSMNLDRVHDQGWITDTLTAALWRRVPSDPTWQHSIVTRLGIPPRQTFPHPCAQDLGAVVELTGTSFAGAVTVTTGNVTPSHAIHAATRHLSPNTAPTHRTTDER